MILITGGLGFIGSHTTRSLLDLGESCVVTQHRSSTVPDFLTPELGGRLVVQPADVDNVSQLLAIGQRYEITGVVHLADTAALRLWRRSGDQTWRLERLFDGLLNLLQAASSWNVRRVTIASTIGVYAGVTALPWSEQTPLPPVPSHAIPTAKRCAELLGSFVGSQLGLDVISFRPSAIWGPCGRVASSFFPIPALVHAAVRANGDTSLIPQPLYGQDGGDICYVKDCARAIALIQTAAQLNHTVYNIGSGRVTTNSEVLAAIQRHVERFDIDARNDRSPNTPPADPFLDLTQIQQDTGYRPAYDVEHGVADYIAWLRSGHDR